MTSVKGLAIIALLVGGTSLAMAQGQPTGNYPPVAGGANGNPILDRQESGAPARYATRHHKKLYMSAKTPLAASLAYCETDQKSNGNCACGPAKMPCGKGMWCHAFSSTCSPF
jgi:hypothetical protein